MTVKEHYDNHLGNFYSWYTGDFDKNKNAFKTFCANNSIKPTGAGYAIDLGAGNGIQTIALAELGFKVKAIDFNDQLIAELKARIGDHDVRVFNDDLRSVAKYASPRPELVVCCGDTLPHLDSVEEIEKLIKDCHDILSSNGKIILSFRDYSAELADTDRFIPVKSDQQRILTCFVEYFSERIRVTDLLYEQEDGKWMQKVSSYYKTRIARDKVLDFLKATGFKIMLDDLTNGIITLTGQKNNR